MKRISFWASVLLLCSWWPAMAQEATTSVTVATFAGKAGQRGYLDGDGATAGFYSPSGIVYSNSAGILYVADACNNTIRAITANGQVSTLAGGGYDATQDIILPGGSVDGKGRAARFYMGLALSDQGPYGTPNTLSFGSNNLGIDSQGNLYVADTLSSVIRKVTPDGTVTTIAGKANALGYEDGVGSEARFISPVGVGVDASGNIYVADSGNDTIRKIAPSGVVSTLAGLSKSSGDADGTGSSARFNSVNGIAVAPNGTIYAADTNNHTIRKITASGVVTTLAGLAKKKGASDGLGSQARFNQPHGVAVDASGNVWVADRGNHTIRRITPDGFVTTPGGNPGKSGNANGAGSAAQFNEPCSIAVDASGNVFVADTMNQTIRKATLVAAGSLPGLKIVTPPGRRYVNVNTQQTLSVTASSGASMSYQWWKDGELVPSATGNSYTFSSVQSSDAGFYSVTVASGPSTVTSPFAELRVYPPTTTIPHAIILSQPIDQTVQSGQSVSFTLDMVINTAVAYQWSKNDSPIPGATQQSLTIPSAATSDMGRYKLTITSGSSTVVSQEAQLTVTPANVVAPSISSHPSSQTVEAGASVTFSVVASGTAPLSYQWSRNGGAITGATLATLNLTNVDVAQGGSYAVTVSNAAGSITSTAAILVVNPPVATSKIVNLSIRSYAGTDAEVLIVGFVVSGSGKTLLVRGIGPALSSLFGLQGALLDPRLSLFQGTSTIAVNDDWGASSQLAQIVSTSKALYAFDLPNGSKDAVLLPTLNNGGYTAQIQGTGSTTGLAMVELYDANPANAARLANVSARTRVGTGDNILIAGFVVSGTRPLKLLIRGIGPRLGTFGVEGALADPQLELYSGTTRIASNNDWSMAANVAEIVETSARLFAFALDPGSKDSVLLQSLNPGSYTVQISGVNQTTGVAMVEVYDASN